MTTTREHFDWARQRALEYVDQGQPEMAMGSMTSDLAKHPGTAGILPDLQPLFVGEYMTAGLQGVRRFIEGLACPAEQAESANPREDTT